MKQTAACLAAALLLCAMTCPALAAEPVETAVVPVGTAAIYPMEVVETDDGDSRRLEKIYLLTADDDPAAIPTGDFDREGWHYTLLDVTRRDNSETETRDYVETVTLNSPSKDMDAIMPQLAATMEVTTEDGYTGLLTLDTASIQVEAAGYKTSSRAISAFRSYPNLSDADTSFIPKTIEDGGRTLTLADIQWQENGGFYNADATYTGTATSKYATGYTVTADYAGEVSRTTTDETIYTAAFSGSPIGDAAASASESGAGWKWLLLLPVGAGAAGMVALVKSMMKKHQSKKEWEAYTK